MTNKQARKILKLFRPGAEYVADTEFVEALAVIKQVRELAHWFEEHGAFQLTVRANFWQIPVPQGLKERIMCKLRWSEAFSA